jgi:hypothetical protein
MDDPKAKDDAALKKERTTGNVIRRPAMYWSSGR